MKKLAISLFAALALSKVSAAGIPVIDTAAIAEHVKAYAQQIKEYEQMLKDTLLKMLVCFYKLKVQILKQRLIP
ncbi:hypothetical protein J0E37_001710 [Campylobacter upsaliensis]|nr:hypothetical protein [Campylobacter upsaliensis]